VSWQAYRLRAGETLPQVAAKFSMPVETLRAVNGIGVRTRVNVGHALLVPSQHVSVESEETLANAVFTTVPQGRTFYYRVKRGDTMAAIATRYAVSAQDIRGWNGLVQNAVRPDQQLRITSDLAPHAARAKRPTGNRILPTKSKRTAPAPAAKAATPAGAKPPVHPKITKGGPHS
jgi:membrane-bound lytic murein transglycosylase D